jgi:hypothetical protein
MVAATFALDVFSTLNSSPQTTELFADDREDSLMHWVKIGGAVAVGGGVVGTVKSGSPWPLVGAIAITVMMVWFYKHAVSRGQGVPPPENSDR